MGLSKFAAIAVIAAGAGLVSAPVEAQSSRSEARQKPPSVSSYATTIRTRDESGRARTRIVVQRRSYLDGGTEVLPGERKFRDYVHMPTHSPTGFIDNTAFSRNETFHGPFDLPGKNNPFQP